MAKAFAKGIPPEDWYETGPVEDDWNDRPDKLIVHLPTNSLYRPENMETADHGPEPERGGISSCVKTDAVVSKEDYRSLPGGVSAAGPTESKDMESDDERISRVILSCMEPCVANIKAEPSEDSSEQGTVPGPFSIESLTVRSDSDGKAQRLLKLKQSGISPEMLRRRLQRIEEKLSVLRGQSKTSADVPQDGSASESQSVDLDHRQTVSESRCENISHNQYNVSDSQNSAAEMDRQSCPRLDQLETARELLNSFDDFPHNLKVDTSSAELLHKIVSYPLSGSSVSSDQPAAGSSVSELTHLPSPLDAVPNSAHVYEVGHQVDASCNQLLWYVGCLSLDTKWDSQFIECQAVRQTLLEAMRNWRLRKPLDLIMSGQLRDVALDWTPMKTTWKTDSTVDCCWNSVLWYFGALLDEPADRPSQHFEEDVGTDKVQVLPEDDEDDWWGIRIDKAHLPVAGPVEDREKAGNVGKSVLSSEEPGVPLLGIDNQKSCRSALGPSAENTASKPSPVINSVASPSEKLPSAPAVDAGRTNPSRSGSSRKEKSEPSAVQKLPEPSSHSSSKPSSQKRKRKHDDKKSKHSKLAANSSDQSEQPAKDSRPREQEPKKENKKGASDKEREKHSKKAKKHKQDNDDDVKDRIKKHLESVESNRGGIADLLRLLVGSDEKKLSLLSKAICSAKQFDSHRLTTSTSLHWAVALALLDENASEDNTSIPASFWSKQQQECSSETNTQLNSVKGVVTESSVKRVFDSVSDFMNAILSGKSASDLAETKSAAANGLSASHLDELRISESENAPSSSPTSLKIPLASKIKMEVETDETRDENRVDQKVELASTVPERTDNAVVVEAMKKVRVDKPTVEKHKFVSPEENGNRKLSVSKEAIASEGLKMEGDSKHKPMERRSDDEVSKKTVQSDDAKDGNAKQLKKLSNDGKILTSSRDKTSAREDRKGSHHWHSKKENSGTVDKSTINSSSSQQSSTKKKPSSDHRSKHDNSKHTRHNKKSSSHDRHKKSSTSGKQASSDRPFTSSFEIISDTELDGQSTSANGDRASRKSKRHTRTGTSRADAESKTKTGTAHVDSAANAASRLNRSAQLAAAKDDGTTSLVQSEKLPIPVTTPQPSVTSASASSAALAHIAFRQSAIYKMANSSTAPPVKTATTDMFLASRGPRFMQTFRRSQIAKRRSQRESQQTATGGKLLATSHRPPSSMIPSKPAVRPIGLSFEATLAALLTPSSTSQSDVSESPLQSSVAEDSSTVVVSSTATSIPSASSPLSSAINALKSPSKLNSTSSADDVVLPFSAPPLPTSPTAAEDDGLPPLPEDNPCDSRTTSVAGSPPPDLSLLCADRLSTSLDICEQFEHIPVLSHPLNPTTSLSDASPNFNSVYPTVPGYGSLSSVGSISEPYFSLGDVESSYWMSGYMSSYGAYGYESSMYNVAYPWYYGQAWNMTQHLSMLSFAVPPLDSVPPSFDVLASCDESYASYTPLPPPPIPQDASFSPLSTSQQESVSPWSLFSPSSASFLSEPRFLSPPFPQIPTTCRLRAPPRLSSDDESPRPVKSPLLPSPVQPPIDSILTLKLPGTLARPSSSSEELTKCRAVVGPRKKRFFVYSNNAQLKAEVMVSFIA